MVSTGPLPYFEASEHGSLRPPVEVHRLDAQHDRVRTGAHAHRDLEILYFSNGSGEHTVGRRSWTVSPGDLFLVPPGVPHDLSAMGDATGWALEFSPRALSATQEAGQTLMLWRGNPLLSPFLASEQHADVGRIFVPEHRRSDWEQMLTGLQLELEVRDEGYRLATSAHLVLVLVQLARLAQDFTGQLRLRQEPLLAAAFEAIERGFRGPLTLGQVAADVGVSPGHLTTMLGGRTGRTVVDWITERRMAEARQLLSMTDLPADTIARKVGFRDPAYFNRRFRQVHGRPPGAWRRSASEP